MTQHQFRRVLQAEAAKHPTRWKAAERLGISESTLSRVINGKHEPGPALLKRFGLKRQIMYVPHGKVSADVKGFAVPRKVNIATPCTDTQV